jgi:hypothetical protein
MWVRGEWEDKVATRDSSEVVLAAQHRAKGWGKHVIVLRVDVGTLGEELVDEAELARLRRKHEGGEGGEAILRWGRGEAVV